MLWKLGSREEAITAAQEATEHYRDIARKQPENFGHLHASALDRLAALFWKLDRKEEAVTAVEEAADAYRALARAQPTDLFKSEVAKTLNNLTGLLWGWAVMRKRCKRGKKPPASIANCYGRMPSRPACDTAISPA
jgi:tetratricopeptide (TPR) repeat protein